MSKIGEKNHISIIEDLTASKFSVENDVFYIDKKLHGNKSNAYTVLVWLLYNYLRMSTNEIKEYYGKRTKNQVWHRINDFRKVDKNTIDGLSLLKKIDEIKLEYIKAITNGKERY